MRLHSVGATRHGDFLSSAVYLLYRSCVSDPVTSTRASRHVFLWVGAQSSQVRVCVWLCVHVSARNSMLLEHIPVNELLIGAFEGGARPRCPKDARVGQVAGQRRLCASSRMPVARVRSFPQPFPTSTYSVPLSILCHSHILLVNHTIIALE